MVIGVILLENGVNVSVQETTLSISVRIANNTESELSWMIKIDLIGFIKSSKLIFHGLNNFIFERICCNTWVILKRDYLIRGNQMNELQKIDSLFILLKVYKSWFLSFESKNIRKHIKVLIISLKMVKSSKLIPFSEHILETRSNR